MGIIGFVLKAFLKIAKPFLKQAMIESILELIAELTGTEISTGEATTWHEFETMPLPDIPTTVFDLI